jgi:PAS domain S-box-containing protein
MPPTAIASQSLLSAFLATVPDIIYFKDRQLRYISVSASLAQRFNSSAEGMLGKSIFDYFDDAQARTFHDLQLKTLNTGEALIDHLITDRWPDGRVRWALVSVMPLLNDDGEIVGIFGTEKDITAAKLTEQALEKANRELRAMSRKAGMAEIANNVLHNVGNALNSVNVSAGLIAGRIRDSKTQGLAKAVQLINEHAMDLGDFLTRDERGKAFPGYLNKLVAALAEEKQSITDELGSLIKGIDHIKDIVATQQTYSGATSLVEPVQINDLMEDALRMNTASIAWHKITVLKDFADVPLLLLDKHLVLQILVNLIGNAKHAMDGVSDRSHQITLRVNIAEPPDEPRLTIRVEDNGEGIGPENLARLFAHGFTTRKNGHGFGLHSCALAAKEMFGTITAHSDGLGKGAAFTLSLPVNLA